MVEQREPTPREAEVLVGRMPPVHPRDVGLAWDVLAEMYPEYADWCRRCKAEQLSAPYYSDHTED